MKLDWESMRSLALDAGATSTMVRLWKHRAYKVPDHWQLKIIEHARRKHRRAILPSQFEQLAP